MSGDAVAPRERLRNPFVCQLQGRVDRNRIVLIRCFDAPGSNLRLPGERAVDPSALDFSGFCRYAGPPNVSANRRSRKVSPTTNSHPIVGLDSQDGGPPNAADKRTRPRRAGGAALARPRRAGGAALARLRRAGGTVRPGPTRSAWARFLPASAEQEP